MPRKHNKKSTQKKGGGCPNQVDITRYTQACNSSNQLPLDGIFAKHFAASQSGGKQHKKRSSKRKRSSKSSKSSKRRRLRGGGYSIMPDTNIGNLPEVKGYSDCCPPVMTKSGAVWSNNFQPLCGQTGGKHKKRTKSSKSKKLKRRRRKQKAGGIKGMSGVDGNFSPDMSTRQFGCRQPFWKPDCT
jgi:hypothetical protein